MENLCKKKKKRCELSQTEMVIGNPVTLPQILSQESKINIDNLHAVLMVTLSNNIYLGNIFRQLPEIKF